MEIRSLAPGLPRRRFVRTLIIGAAASVWGGRPWRGTLAATVTPRLVPEEVSRLRLRLADFAPLQASFGSVRLGFAAVNQLAPMPPFIVTRDSSRYHCVSAQCTHAGTLIPVFSGAAKQSRCPNHGSVFGPSGNVVRGPATEPLPSYRTELLDDGYLQVELYDFPAYNVTVDHVLDGGASRVAVSFHGQRNVDYEILAAPSAMGPWQSVSFATSVLASATSKTIKGTDQPLTVYLERTAEAMLFSVSARVRTV